MDKFKVGDRVKIISGDARGQVRIIHTTTRGNRAYPYGVILNEENRATSCRRPKEDWVPKGKGNHSWFGDGDELQRDTIKEEIIYE